MLFHDLIRNALGEREYEFFPEMTENIELSGISSDSRDIKNGFVFVALPGYRSDGVSFIQEAVLSGARVIVTEAGEEICRNVSELAYVVRTDNIREIYALLVKEFYGHIDRKFDFIGVTGTNGKTSTTHLISHILNSLGTKAAVIGTLGAKSPDVTIPAERTTPDCKSIYETLSVFDKYKTKAVAMEVSSHALEQKRTYGISFGISVFTNLTQDHLDFHKNMKAYMKAKLRLFSQTETGIINIDDRYGREIKELAGCRVITYSLLDENADYFAKEIIHSPDGSRFILVAKDRKEYGVTLKTPGTFSVYNATAALAAATEYGIETESACRAISQAEPVPGRFERVKNGRGINVIIDYAHTPDGMEKALSTAREFTEGRLISVFGCGGNRDREKRAVMGRIATELSDYTVITSDNPRNENELRIACDVENGIEKRDAEYNVIIDRQAAIEHAIMYAEKNDTVIIMGKGHEEYQQFGGIKLVSNDRETVLDILRRT